MARSKYGKIRTVKHRRQREQKTDYKKRLSLLKSGLPRLVIRVALNTTTVQIVEYHPDGDKVIVTVNSKNLTKEGLQIHTGNIPSAYLAGYKLGKLAQKKKVKKAILDLGLQNLKKGGRIFAALKGAIDSGIDIPHNPEALPTEEKVNGEHISNYMSKNPDKFTKYTIKPDQIKSNIADVKKKLESQ